VQIFQNGTSVTEFPKIATFGKEKKEGGFAPPFSWLRFDDPDFF